MTVEINTQEYIQQVLREKTPQELLQDQQPRLFNSIIMGYKTIFLGKKWIIYIFLNLFILFMDLAFNDRTYADIGEAYVGFVYENMFPFLFVFGCLILSLPISADEITDKTVDLTLVRPIKRETYWLSRWIVINTVVYAINIILFLITYIYMSTKGEEDFFTEFGQNFDVYANMLLVLLVGTFIYAGLFLLVGMIGNRGFTFGLILAIVEPLFLGFLLLEDNKYVPITNIMRISQEIFIEFFNTDSKVDLTWSIWYTVIFTFIILVSGGYYLRKREYP
ncbi:MAG: hypothetical protein INQ03_22330 [Candidatus Heimdallarchaeota archaeon]|nr:hypothetical protein [Candidatus Heimdallarchaeota archaeon]